MELQNRKCCQQKMTTWQKIATLMLALSAATYVDATAAGDSLEEAASEGKLHYEVIMREAKMPKWVLRLSVVLNNFRNCSFLQILNIDVNETKKLCLRGFLFFFNLCVLRITKNRYAKIVVNYLSAEY